MINQRLKAFALDPKNPPKAITREYLVRLINMEKHPGRPIKTFRDYIEILIKRFKRLEFTEDSITIRDNDVEIRNALKDIETSHSSLHEAFQELKVRTNSNRVIFEKLIKILEDLWLDEPIREGSYNYFKNRELIVHLYTVNLLMKIETAVEPAWTICDDCELYFNKIQNIYRVNPVNIIPSLYFAEPLPESLENEVVLALNNIIKRGEDYGANFLKKLVEAGRGYNEVFQFSKSFHIISEEALVNFDVNIIFQSFSSLLIAFVIQCDSDVDNYKQALYSHENSWYEIREATKFAKALKSFQLNISPSIEVKSRLISEYLTTFKEMVSKLKRFVQWDNWFSLKKRSIWNEDKEILNNIRRNVENNNFDLALHKIRSLLEDKLNLFIFDYSRILFGNVKWKRGLPEEINRKLRDIERYVPILNVDKGDILYNLTIEDHFLIIKYLNSVKTEKKIELLRSVDKFCDQIAPKIIKREQIQNPWVNEILELVEELSQFYFHLFIGDIPCPWNSNVLRNLLDIQNYESQVALDQLDQLLSPYLLIDKELRSKSYIENPLKFLELIYAVTSKKNDLTIHVDYKKEEIKIEKKISSEFEL